MVTQYSDEFKRSMVKKIGAPGGWSAATGSVNGIWPR